MTAHEATEGIISDLASQEAKVYIAFEYDEFFGFLYSRACGIWFCALDYPSLKLSFMIDLSKIWRIDVRESDGLHVLHYTVDHDEIRNGLGIPFH